MRFIAAILSLAIFAFAVTAQAQNTVQQWMPTKASVLKADTRFTTGDATVGKLQIQDFSPDIRFDPRDLDNSAVLLSAVFMPVTLPGNRAIDDDTRARAAAVFISSKIRQKSDNEFEVLGFFRMNGQQRQLVFRMDVVPTAQAAERPALIFSGQFNAPVGNMAPQLGLPAMIPVVFHVETVPFP